MLVVVVWVVFLSVADLSVVDLAVANICWSLSCLSLLVNLQERPRIVPISPYCPSNDICPAAEAARVLRFLLQQIIYLMFFPHARVALRAGRLRLLFPRS